MSTQPTVITQDLIRTQLESEKSIKALSFAVFVLQFHQTLDERLTGTSRQKNAVGFSKADAALGAYLFRQMFSPDIKKEPISIGFGILVPQLVPSWEMKGTGKLARYAKQVFGMFGHMALATGRDKPTSDMARHYGLSFQPDGTILSPYFFGRCVKAGTPDAEGLPTGLQHRLEFV